MALDKKAMLGVKVRRLRRDLKMTQAQMAESLGISASYLNLIEHNQRPLTVPLLLKLGQTFDVDLQSFAEDEEAQLTTQLREVFADPLFATADVPRQDINELAAVAPQLGQAITQLYGAYRAAQEDLTQLAERVAHHDKALIAQTPAFPVEDVRDFFNDAANHFPELEEAAEQLWHDAGLEVGGLESGLARWFDDRHRLMVKVLPQEVMGQAIRRWDRHSRRLLLSEMLPPSGRVFQLATQISLIDHGGLLDRIVDRHGFATPQAARIARHGLANYFAGAVMMPYDRFLEAARALRYDIERLEMRFEASFEQVCHRLTTLQRPGAKGVPFFLIRVDKAGNVSKRFSAAGGFQFARTGGACPRWVVYDAFRSPDILMTQLAELPDGTVYLSLARTVTKPGGGFGRPAQEYALGLGCEIAHATNLVYADGLQLSPARPVMPIGINCRLCERMDCGQRAYPPLNQRLIMDDHQRGVSAYSFGRQD